MSKPASRNSQLLFSGQKCTKCLLETYVKRSLSLNDGRTKKHRVKLSKKVKKDEGGIQARRASSDSSTYRLSIERLNLKTTDCPKCREPEPASHRKIRKTPSRTKSFFRSFINVFSRKTTKVKGERALETDAGQFKTEEGGFGESSPYYTHRGKTVKKKHSLKRTLFSNVEKTESLKRSSTLASGGVDRLPDVVNRDSDNSYFECVSEELEWIVKAIQSGPKEDCDVTPSAACLDADSHEGNDTTERIIQLLKQHGDIMDEKIRRSGCVHAFLQRLSYSSFQQLADHYVAQIPSPLPQTTDASPELVRLAFTLDFTAKVAGLCSQTVGRIMGFGNQYLQDSFTQMCAAHRQISKDLEGQNTCDPD